jgi:hypothetical protein
MIGNSPYIKGKQLFEKLASNLKYGKKMIKKSPVRDGYSGMINQVNLQNTLLNRAKILFPINSNCLTFAAESG